MDFPWVSCRSTDACININAAYSLVSAPFAPRNLSPSQPMLHQFHSLLCIPELDLTPSSQVRKRSYHQQNWTKYFQTKKGWGGTAVTGGAAPNILQWIAKNTLTNAHCQSLHTVGNSAFVFEHKICTFNAAGQGICQGQKIINWQYSIIFFAVPTIILIF